MLVVVVFDHEAFCNCSFCTELRFSLTIYFYKFCGRNSFYICSGRCLYPSLFKMCIPIFNIHIFFNVEHCIPYKRWSVTVENGMFHHNFSKVYKTSNKWSRFMYFCKICQCSCPIFTIFKTSNKFIIS